jgi:Holliday junction resolvase RusA-like endonuclease
MRAQDFHEYVSNGTTILRTLIDHPDPVPRCRRIRPVRRPGRLLCRFGVGGRPAPWVTHGTSGTKAAQRAALRDWQTRIIHAAGLAMRLRGGSGAAVHSGPVEVWIDFVFAPDRRLPDRDNLQKGATDAIQGIIIINDCEVVGGECRRLIGPHEGAIVEVWAVRAPTVLD